MRCHCFRCGSAIVFPGFLAFAYASPPLPPCLSSLSLSYSAPLNGYGVFSSAGADALQRSAGEGREISETPAVPSAFLFFLFSV